MPAELIASYTRVAALAAAGSFALPAAGYPLDEAGRARAGQASSPSEMILVLA